MLQKIYIVRHGNRLDFVTPEWFNTAKRRYDPPLSQDGFIQAQELGKRLKYEKIAHIFSSPFLRAIQTANEIAEILDLSIKIETGLSEWLNPDWMSEMPETQPPEELSLKYSRIDWNYKSCIIPKYPENEETVNNRTGETAKILVKEFAEDILLVGHNASVIGATRGLVGGNPIINAHLCCLIKVVGFADKWKLAID
jgi:broad specificity phosphatase PhoE